MERDTHFPLTRKHDEVQVFSISWFQSGPVAIVYGVTYYRTLRESLRAKIIIFFKENKRTRM